MNKIRLAIIKRVLMLETEEELKKIECAVLDSISRECDKDDKELKERKKWKEQNG
jgi:reverse gyrase